MMEATPVAVLGYITEFFINVANKDTFPLMTLLQFSAD